MANYYRNFSDYLRQAYGVRVQKIAVHAGFTCPNRDGTKGRAGCIFCNNAAFSPASRNPVPLAEQIQQQISYYRARQKAEKFIIYFQSFTNTYAPVDHLKIIYDVIHKFEDVVALAVGTRPDCISKKILDLLESYCPRYDVWVEYGLESPHNRTLTRINRCHTYEDFIKALALTQARKKLFICAHLILGLPGETQEDLLESANRMANLGLNAIKIHPIQVIRDTELVRWYRNGEFTPLSLDQYVSVLCDFLERLPPELIIQRLTADAPKNYLIAPLWCLEKQQLLRAVAETFARRGTRQGARYRAHGELA